MNAPFDAEPLGPTSTATLLAPRRIYEQEAEASRFAGALLIPRRFIEACAEEDMGEALAALNRTRVSAIAGVMAFSRNLLPGFCFLIDEDEEGFWVVESSGTQLALPSDTKSRVAQLRDNAYDFGEVHLAGRRVLWFRLASQTVFALPDDDRTTTQMLRDSIATAVPLMDQTSMFARINGIVGGMLSKEERAQTESQALSVLEHRFEADPEFQDLFDNADFRLYLRRKAVERVRSNNHVSGRLS